MAEWSGMNNRVHVGMATLSQYNIAMCQWRLFKVKLEREHATKILFEIINQC